MTNENGMANTEEIRQFWRHLYGKGRGFLCIATADRVGDRLEDVQHEYFPYPAESKDAAEYVLLESERGREVYHAVHLLTTRERKKDQAAQIWALWADLDGAAVPENPKPTAVIESSPGRFHAYWLLSKPLDPERAENLNRHLTYAIGADKKWALATLLRPPRTTNYKRDDPTSVTLASLDAGRVWDPDEIDAILPAESSRNGHGGNGSEAGAGDPPVRLSRSALRIWHGEDVIRKPTGEIDRSRSLYRIGGVLARGRAAERTIVAALQERDETLGWRKYTRRADANKCYSDIAAEVIADADVGSKAYAENGPKERGARGRGSKKDAPTDDELRDRYLAAYPDHAYGLGTWRHYQDGIWHDAEAFEIRRGICEVMEEAKPEGIRPNQRLLSSVEALTRVEVSVSDRRWDADPEIIVCSNGALNLAARELLPHSKGHYATAGVPYAYSEDAHSEAWERVLDEIVRANLGDAGAAFLQEFAGYALTSRTDLEVAVWLTGPHGGGRSTILTGLGAMLGPKAGVLSLSDIERSSFALTNLPGKTLVTATEQPQVYVRGGGTLNAIISGEPIQVDRKYRDPITVVPRCKIAWAMNELPRIGNADDGIFRRVKILELPEILAEDRDPGVKEDVKDSGAAILNWALDGLARLQKRGRFEVPATIQGATDHFKETNDVPAMFIDEACELVEDASEAGQRLYQAYAGWCKANGHKPLASNNAAREWRRLGFAKKHTKKGERWDGVRVTDEAWERYIDPVRGY